MLPREPPGSFCCGSFPHEAHVKMELLGRLKIHSNLTVAEMTNGPLNVWVPPSNMLLVSSCLSKNYISQNPLLLGEAL